MESVKIRVCRDDQVARFQKGSVYLWVKVKMLSASSGLEQCVPEEQAIITCVRQRYLPPGPHNPPGTSLHDDGGVPLGLTREGGFGSVVEEIKGAALACLQDRGVDKTGDGDKVGRGGGECGGQGGCGGRKGEGRGVDIHALKGTSGCTWMQRTTATPVEKLPWKSITLLPGR